jgi:hypothetical protein
MDLDAVGDRYHVWLDKVNLTAYWFLGRCAGPTSPTISPDDLSVDDPSFCP